MPVVWCIIWLAVTQQTCRGHIKGFKLFGFAQEQIKIVPSLK